MPRPASEDRNPDCRETAAAAQVAADCHVHLYPDMNPGRALSAGRDNLAEAARMAGLVPDRFALCLTETGRDDAFAALAAGRLHPEGWRIDRIPDDPDSLHAVRLGDGAALLILAGRQIGTAEGIEVLALATSERFPDGRPLNDVLGMLRDRRIPAVLPWGVGKWFGRRGALVKAQVAQGAAPGLMVGDNAGRPQGWPMPATFRCARSNAIPVLPGSDPLPISGAERMIGRYGCLLSLEAADRPAAALRETLFGMGAQPPVLGGRRSAPVVIAEQLALRRRGRSAAGQGSAA